MYCVISAESTKSKKKTKVAGMDNIMKTARLQQEPPTSTGTSLDKSVGSKYTVYLMGCLYTTDLRGGVAWGSRFKVKSVFRRPCLDHFFNKRVLVQSLVDIIYTKRIKT